MPLALSGPLPFGGDNPATPARRRLRLGASPRASASLAALGLALLGLTAHAATAAPTLIHPDGIGAMRGPHLGIKQALAAYPDGALRVGYAAINAIWREAPYGDAGDAYIAFSVKGREWFRTPCSAYCQFDQAGKPTLPAARDTFSDEAQAIFVLSPALKTPEGIHVGSSIAQLMRACSGDAGTAKIVKVPSRDFGAVEKICFTTQGVSRAPSRQACGLGFHVQARKPGRGLLGRYAGDALMSDSFDRRGRVVAIELGASPCAGEAALP